MTTLSYQPSLRPVPALPPALPPTLQPHAILNLAPPTDRRRSLAASVAVYAILGGGIAWLARAGAVAVQAPPPTVGRVILNEPAAADPSPAVAHAPVAAKSPEVPVIAPAPTTPSMQNLDTPQAMPTSFPAAPAQPTASTAVPGATGNDGGGGMVTLSGDAVRVLHQVDPVYPSVAMAAHLQGQVVVRMTIDARGLPTQVDVLSGPQVFQGPALRAARQWRFEPARQDGQPVPATFLLTLSFVLRGA